MRRKTIPVLAACALVATLLGGCTEPHPPLAVGTNQWLGYEPLYLARAQGAFDESDVRLVEYTSATQVIRAFRNGVIEGAALTLDEVLLLLENGLDPTIVLVMDYSHGADAVLGGPDVPSLEALSGRRVGVETTALGAFMLDRALERAGLERTDVVIVPLQAGEQERVFEEGRIDAVVTFDPTRERLLRRGARVIFDSSQMPGEIVDVLVMARPALTQHAQAIRDLLDGWFGARARLQRDPLGAARAIAPRLQSTPEDVLRAFEGLTLPSLAENRRLLLGPAPAIADSGRRLAQSMLASGLLRRPVDLSVALDPAGAGALLP